MSWNFACSHILLRGNFCISEILPKKATQKFLCSKSGILKRTGFKNYYQNIFWTSKGGFIGSLCLCNFFSLLWSIAALWHGQKSTLLFENIICGISLFFVCEKGKHFETVAHVFHLNMPRTMFTVKSSGTKYRKKYV